MKLLLVSDFYPPSPGGLESHVQRLAAALASRGHRVTVATTTPDPAPTPGVEVVTLRLTISGLSFAHLDPRKAFPPPWADRQLTQGLAGLVEHTCPDLVHAHGWSAEAAAQALVGTSAPLVVTLHDYGLLCPQKNLLRDDAPCGHTAGVRCLSCPGSNQHPVKRLGLATAVRLRRTRHPLTSFIAVSGAVARRHRNVAGCQDIEVIPNFITERAQRSEQTPKSDLLFVGPDAPYKGIGVARACMELLRAQGHQLTLRHVGGSAASTAPGYVSTGRLTGQTLDDAYRRATMVLMPVLWEEPCPTVAIEAMSHGCPIVGSDLGGLPELVAHGETGLLVAPNDPPALAGAVSCLLGQPELLSAFGHAAYDRAERFTGHAVVPRIEAHYQRALARARTGIA